MRVRRIIVSSLLLNVLLGFLVACSGSAVTPSPTPASSNESSQATLILWHGWTGAPLQALSTLVDSFNRQSTSGRVLLQSVPLATFAGELRVATERGTSPHMALIPNTWLGTLAQQQSLLPLDDRIPSSDLQPLLATALGGAYATDAQETSHLYGLPISFDTLVLYYNQANLTGAPTDSSQLLNLAHGLSAPDATQPRWGLAFNLTIDNTIGYLYAFQGRLFDENGEPALAGDGQQAAEQWLSWLATLQSDSDLLVRPDSGVEIDREIKNQNVFMTFGWAHQLESFRRLWGDQLGVATLPVLSETGKSPQPFVQSDTLVINSRSSAAEQQVALEFMRFMIATDAQQVLLQADLQPVNTAVALDANDSQDAAARAFREQAENGVPMPNSANRDAIRQVIQLMQRKVLAGQATPAEAVADADQRLRALLNLPSR